MKTAEEVLEKLRKMLIGCGRKGKNLMIDLGKTQPDFINRFTNEGSFKSELVFNCAEWHDPANHMKYVRDEDKEADEEFEAGYVMNDSSTLMIVSTAENETDISS